MRLADIVERHAQPMDSEKASKIPWDAPAFSERMLREHLTQDHTAASRPTAMIDRHIDWIHTHVLGRHSTRILDLGCGPGLYTARLAGLGHTCAGIDFSPASIRYAKQQAETLSLDCTYIHEDVRVADYGIGYGLVMLTYGEFNVFPRSDARMILAKAYDALAADGVLLLEPHTFTAVQKTGQHAPSWFSQRFGLFADSPYICLMQHFWVGEDNLAITRYFIIDALSGTVTRYSESIQAYHDVDYRMMLSEAGFAEIEFHPSLSGASNDAQRELFVVMARK